MRVYEYVRVKMPPRTGNYGEMCVQCEEDFGESVHTVQNVCECVNISMCVCQVLKGGLLCMVCVCV